ncbi:MAG TPA: hypothetical protein VIK78_18260 [Ruminiclostridium sp.]
MDNNYQRLFYIFRNMDSDVGNPTGYLKVEINCEVAKIQISMSNLLNSQGLIYQLYGIKKVENQLTYTVICDVPSANGRADVKLNADCFRIGSNALSLEEINIFAIITKVPSREPSIKCPLVAYTKGELVWRKEFETLLLKKEQPTSNDYISKDVRLDDTKAGRVHEGTTENVVIENAKPILTPDKIDNVEKRNETKQIPDILDGSILFDYTNDKAKVFEDMQKAETKVSEEQNHTEPTFDQRKDMQPQNAAENYTDKKFDITSKFQATLTNIYNTEKSSVLEQEMMPELTVTDDDILSSAQKNFKDISSIEIEDRTKNELNIPSLKNELDKSFEIFNPFKMKSRSIKWWKINSPGYLNNILFRNNIKNYLLFNPKVLLAHYKYRYIIFGIQNDRYSGKEYFICGVPGVYSIDENPFGSMGSWAQLEGYKPKYGAFGYWLILIDPRTGKIMKIK